MTDKPMPPKFENAPGLVVRQTAQGWRAFWQARSDLIERGYSHKTQRLWSGIEPSEFDRTYVSEQCNRFQTKMLLWGRGGVPVAGAFDGTLQGLIYAYQTDVDSTYRKLRYQVRRNHDAILRRIAKAYGKQEVRDINARAVIAWHKEWAEGGKVAMSHAFVSQLRTLFGFGATILESADCERMCGVLHKMRFAMPKPRGERITAEQANALRAMAHEIGYHSIAMAQAFQFDLMLRQKDVIGEWVPLAEPGTSEVVTGTHKWLSGLRWSEIDEHLVLRHTTSKRQKDIEVDLKLAPMVMDELSLLGEIREITHAPVSGPIIVSEFTGLPFTHHEFRRKWRIVADKAGIPKTVKNMDSRAGAISEATDAGASLELVRHAATHSNVSTTAGYSRGSVEKTAEVMKIRVASRNKNGPGTKGA